MDSEPSDICIERDRSEPPDPQRRRHYGPQFGTRLLVTVFGNLRPGGQIQSLRNGQLQLIAEQPRRASDHATWPVRVKYPGDIHGIAVHSGRAHCQSYVIQLPHFARDVIQLRPPKYAPSPQLSAGGLSRGTLPAA